MDPGLLFLSLSCPPQGDAAGGLHLPAALGVVAYPTWALTASQRSDAARQWSSLGAVQRITWLLEAGDEPSAVTILRRMDGPMPPALQTVLAGWTARCLAEFRLPAGAGPVVVVGGSLPEARLAYDDVMTLLDLPVRWAGPLVIVIGNDPVSGLPPGETRFARPACPLLRLPEIPAPAEVRARLAARLTPLVLALQSPPERGWPPWLVMGLSQIIGATAGGLGPSPKAMLDRRAQAGLIALRRILEAPAEEVDPHLAEALATALTVPWRRGTLPMVLDRLRSGASSEAAIAGATGATLADLLVQR